MQRATSTAVTPQKVLVRGALLHNLLQMLLGCCAHVLQQVVLGQHQQLSVHVGDDTGSPDSLLQNCSLSKGLVLAVGHDLQPHLFWPCIEKGVGGGICHRLGGWQ